IIHLWLYSNSSIFPGLTSAAGIFYRVISPRPSTAALSVMTLLAFRQSVMLVTFSKVPVPYLKVPLLTLKRELSGGRDAEFKHVPTLSLFQLPENAVLYKVRQAGGPLRRYSPCWMTRRLSCAWIVSSQP